MIRHIASFLGRRLLGRAVASSVQGASGGALDFKLGLRLLRDGRVPFKSKIAGLGLGLGAVFILEILELPLQTALMLLLPFVGIAADLALDGVELLAGPIIVASLVLPYLAPRDIVEQIRAEGQPQGQVYEANANIK
ncbi:MAG: hypothetical protein KY445_08725 [Armatimonadetes bacterium]|nr:hypothetical protein [Armatimonadota bacterium]